MSAAGPFDGAQYRSAPHAGQSRERRMSLGNIFLSAHSGIAPRCSENCGQPIFCRRTPLTAP